MIYCPNCGAQNQDSATNCQNCGTQLSTGAPMNQNFNQPQVPVAQPGKGLAIASLVCGIVSFFCFGIVLGVLAVVFGAVAKKKGFTGGMATAGIVLGVVGLAIYVLFLVLWGGAIASILS